MKAAALSVLAIVAATLAACASPSGTARLSAADESTPVPTHEEPSHRLVFSNGLVRVLDIRFAAGHTTRWHVHSNPVVGVSISEPRLRIQLLGGEFGPVVMPAPAVPNVSHNWEQALPFTHRVANVDSFAYHRILAEWLASPAPCEPLQPLPGFNLEHEGRYGKAWSIRLGPGETGPLHRHACPGLTVQGDEGSSRNVGAAPEAAGGSGAGSWFWRGPNFEHRLTNDGNRPVTLFEIDWQ